MHLAARAFGILATVVGSISMIISWCICCIACDMRFIKGLGIGYGFCVIFQGLTMLMFGADICKTHDCAFASAAGLTIAALILWAVASLLCFNVPPFVEDASGGATVLPVVSPPQTQAEKNVTEKITEVYNADGSKEVVKETINPDGSKVVETTKYPSPKDVENGYFETHDIMLRS